MFFLPIRTRSNHHLNLHLIISSKNEFQSAHHTIPDNNERIHFRSVGTSNMNIKGIREAFNSAHVPLTYLISAVVVLKLCLTITLTTYTAIAAR